MATVAYSSLLGLALPTQGDLTGQWGDEVNDYITKYLDASVAGGLSITADVTLTKTTGSALGATSSQYAILTCSPASVNIVVTAPAAYKIYVVNNTSASYTVTIRGAGPTTGVVLSALEKAVVAWNGTDFFKVATSATDGVSTFSAGSTGLTPSSATSGVVTLAGTLAVANGGTGVTTSTGTTNVVLSNSPTLVAPVLGTPASGTVTNLTGTASININGTVGATTANTGAFTTVSATGEITSTFAGRQYLGTVTSNGAVYQQLGNTSGDIIYGTSSSAGVFWASGYSTNWAANFGTTLNTALIFGVNNVGLAKLDTTGLAVTGTLSATGNISMGTSGASTFTIGNASGGGQSIINLTGGTANNNWQIATNLYSPAGMSITPSTTTGGTTFTTPVVMVTSTGLAVTGTLSATGTLSGGTSGTAYSFSGSAPAGSLTLDASGRLGIGVTNPSVGIVVSYGTDGIIGNYYSSSGTNSRISFSNTSLLNNNVSIGSSSDAMVMYTAATERARIDSSGNLLVGTTTASAKFSLEYNGSSVVGENINDSNDTANSTFVQFTVLGTQAGTIKRVASTSATVYNTTSDYRLKTVTGSVTGQGLRIDALKPIDYQWKEGNTQARGFLAHEFQTVYPSSVSGDKDAVDADGKPVYQAMQASTSEVIADLVAELQSLRARVAQLESKP